jgi:hypothetical protein
MSRWVILAVNDENLVDLAAAVVACGSDLKPVAVTPSQLPAAVRQIGPTAVVIDSRLRDRVRLAEDVRRNWPAGGPVLSEGELPALRRLVATKERSRD